VADSDTIERVERDFWQALIDKNTAAATAMVADDCLLAGPSGTMKIDPPKYAAMMEDGQWTLESFEFSDVEVIFPSADVAVIAYKVRQKGTMKDGPMDMRCADSSVWVKDGGSWKCALHTETILDRPEAS
jgi:ketosteroid isomerase-like protein